MGSGAGVPGPLVTLAPVPCDVLQSVCRALGFRLPSELGCKSAFFNGGPEDLLFDLSHSLLHSGGKSYICVFIAPLCSQERPAWLDSCMLTALWGKGQALGDTSFRASQCSVTSEWTKPRKEQA